jgi:hypothetical protein
VKFGIYTSFVSNQEAIPQSDESDTDIDLRVERVAGPVNTKVCAVIAASRGFFLLLAVFSNCNKSEGMVVRCDPSFHLVHFRRNENLARMFSSFEQRTILFSIYIHRPVAVAKELIISISVLESQDALTAMKA